MNLHNICQQFKLGSLQQQQFITTGLMHQSFKVTTQQGIFIVKQLNKSLAQYHDFACTEAIAKQFAEAGIAARSALAFDEDVAIYRFIDGESIAVTDLGLEHIAAVAALSARLHCLDLHCKSAPPFLAYETTEQEWQHYGSGFSAERLKQFGNLQKDYDQAYLRLQAHTVVSHRDLTPANLIWRNDDIGPRGLTAGSNKNNPIIIDWELAGMINPDLEVIHNALDVSLSDNNINEQALYHYISNYKLQRHIQHPQPDDLIAACLGSWIHWILFCLKRQNHTFKPLDCEKQCEKALMVIDFVQQNREKLASALSA